MPVASSLPVSTSTICSALRWHVLMLVLLTLRQKCTMGPETGFGREASAASACRTAPRRPVSMHTQSICKRRCRCNDACGLHRRHWHPRHSQCCIGRGPGVGTARLGTDPPQAAASFAGDVIDAAATALVLFTLQSHTSCYLLLQPIPSRK